MRPIAANRTPAVLAFAELGRNEALLVVGLTGVPVADPLPDLVTAVMELFPTTVLIGPEMVADDSDAGTAVAEIEVTGTEIVQGQLVIVRVVGLVTV